MNTAQTIINRLRSATTDELPKIRADYNAYLTTLEPLEQKQVMSQIEPVLHELMKQSINKLDEAVAAYLSRNQHQVIA
jgi:hypothetical protein